MLIQEASIGDVPELLDLQCKCFGPVCDMLDWHDAKNMTETVEEANADFPRFTTLKVCGGDGRIIGSVRGRVEDGSLFIGRLMVLPECQKLGLGLELLHAIEARLPHNRVWLYTCQQVGFTMKFYQKEGFKTYKVEPINERLSWAYMEKFV